MRLSSKMLVLCGLGLVAAPLSGCDGEAADGETGSDGAASTCAPAASCRAVDTECLGLVDNAGESRFGLRISELDITRPSALRTGLVGQVVTSDVLPFNAGCNLDGAGTFSWLLRFDLATGKLDMGGARPVADASHGYRFVDEMVTDRHLQPVTYDLEMDTAGNLGVQQGQDMLVPIYLDAAASEVVILPLRSARLSTGTLSASQNCIGRYNAAGLRPDNGCFPDEVNHAFVTGAELEGLISLEDADAVILPSFAESLCVHLAGNRAEYAVTDAQGVLVCKRDASHAIVFQGDACSVAGQTCTDAVATAARFAASSVRIDD